MASLAKLYKKYSTAETVLYFTFVRFPYVL